jgi:hypothetical protein
MATFVLWNVCPLNNATIIVPYGLRASLIDRVKMDKLNYFL